MGAVENRVGNGDLFVDAVRNAFGAKLRRLRRARDLSQDQLGSKVGLSRGTIATIEGGKQNTLLHHAYLFARALDAKIEELLPTRDEVKQYERISGQSEAARMSALSEMILREARALLQLKSRKDQYEQGTTDETSN